MKTFKMDIEDVKILNKRKFRTFIILLILLLFPVAFFSYYNGFSINSLIIILILILQCTFSVSSTGKQHFVLDANILSFYKRDKIKKSFDLKKVRVVSSVGENESTLIIKDDGNIVGNFHSEILGITTFNELLKDISVINDGTYQS